MSTIKYIQVVTQIKIPGTRQWLEPGNYGIRQEPVSDGMVKEYAIYGEDFWWHFSAKQLNHLWRAGKVKQTTGWE
jgi:hypothetical protein